MKAIKFKVRCAPYQPGEIAGFPEDVAKAHVDAGRAEYHTEKGAKKPAGAGGGGDDKTPEA